MRFGCCHNGGRFSPQIHFGVPCEGTFLDMKKSLNPTRREGWRLWSSSWTLAICASWHWLLLRWSNCFVIVNIKRDEPPSPKVVQWEILGIQDWTDWTNLICLRNGVWERVAKIRIIKTKYFVLIDTHNRNVSNSCAYTLKQNMVGANGLEPLTPCTSSRCSSQLS